MAKVTILGAGDMGTALALTLARNGHDITLWGTERDDAIVAALRSGSPHPRLSISTPANVTIAAANEATRALAGAELVVIAITSDAVRPVMRRLAVDFGSPQAVITVAKGFDAGPEGGAVQLLPDTIAEFTAAPVVAVGGPSKANEVALGQPTAVVFGCVDAAALDLSGRVFASAAYRVEPTDDIVGLEVAAAMKNAYAIALGIPDGLEKRTGRPHHNLRAALFPVAVAEMGELVRLMGGRKETASGLAGAGDLLVTITSGRNRLLGERIGMGDEPQVAIRALTGSGTTIEGYPAVAFGRQIREQAELDETLADERLPLLNAIWSILYRGEQPEKALWGVL